MQQKSPSSVEIKVRSHASEDASSRKRSHNIEENQVENYLLPTKTIKVFLLNFNFNFQAYSNEEANEMHPTLKKKPKIKNGWLF